VRMQTIRDSLDRLLPGRLGSDAEAFAEVLDSLNGDAELFAELIDKFAADTDQRMEALRDIVERGDPAGSAQLRQLTHAISGSALSMGAAALAEAARALSGAAGEPGAWMELFTTMAEKRAEADRKLRFASESAKRGTKT
jgi:HPt (histidine-containing phosphotransfer) domain-containing protein